jgi:sugar phosphate permease
MAKPRWWNYNHTLLVLTWSGWISIYLARSVLPPVLPVLAEELGLTYTQSGLLETAYLIGYIIIKIPAGFLANRIGQKKVLAISMIGYGLANLLISVAAGFYEIFVLRLLVGLFQGIHLPISNALLSDRFKEKQNIAIGINESGPNIGNTLAYPIAVFILSLYGWRYAFALLSLPAFLLSLATFTLMKPEFVVSNIEIKEQNDNLRNYIHLLLPLAIAHGTYNLILRTTFTFTPIFLVEFRGISIDTAGLISTILPLAGIFAKISSGFISDYFGGKNSICVAIFLSSCFLASLILVPVNSVLPLNLIFLGLSLYSFSPIIYSSTTSSLPSNYKSTGLGLVTMFGNFVGAISTTLIGKLIDIRGFSYSFLLLSLLSLVSAAIILISLDLKALNNPEKS